MQPREWVTLALLIVVPLIIAVVVTLWSIKQMAYSPKKPARPKPVLTADELAALADPAAGGRRPAADEATRDTGVARESSTRTRRAPADHATPGAK